jgi:hypothetical protein
MHAKLTTMLAGLLAAGVLAGCAQPAATLTPQPTDTPPPTESTANVITETNPLRATPSALPSTPAFDPNTPPPAVMETGDVYFLGEPIPVAITATVDAVTYSLEWVVSDRETLTGESFTGSSAVHDFGDQGRVAFVPTDRLAKKGVYVLSGENVARRRVLLVDQMPEVADPLTWPFGLITTTDKLERGATLAEEFYRVGNRWFHFDYPIGDDWYFDGPPSINAIGASGDPQAGRISAGFEAFVNRAHELGLQPIMKLLNHYEQIAEPGDLDGPFYNGLRRVQTYYKGKLRYWTLGNEVEGGGYSRFSPEEYARVLKNMSAVLKAVDPAVQIIAGEFYSAEGNVHLETLLQPEYSGAWDVLSGHKVVRLQNGNAPASEYKLRLQTAGLARPFWDTEAEGTIFGGPGEWTGYLFSGFPTSPDRDMHSSVAKHMLRAFCTEARLNGQWAPGFFNPEAPCLGADLFIAMHYNANWEEQWSLRKHWIGPREEDHLDEQNHKVAQWRAVTDLVYGATGLTRIPDTDAADPAAPGTDYAGADGYVYRYGAEYLVALWRNTGNEGADRELSLTTDPNDVVVMVDSFGNPYPLKNDNGTVKVWVKAEVTYVRGFTRLPGFAREQSAGDAPYFLTEPITQAVAGQPYTYSAAAYDSDPLPAEAQNSLPLLTYYLVAAPAGMTINDGQLSWLPAGPGDYPVTVRVTSGQGTEKSAEQTFTLTVAPEGENLPPRFLSRPGTDFARPGFVWWYNANAFDPNGEPVTYALANAPEGMTIDAQTGFVQWTPAGEATVTFTLIVSDGRAETAVKISIVVRAP